MCSPHPISNLILSHLKSFKFNLVNYLFKAKNVIFSYIFTPAIGSHNFLGVCKLFIRAWYFWDHIIMRPILQMHKTNSSAEEQYLQYINIFFIILFYQMINAIQTDIHIISSAVTRQFWLRQCVLCSTLKLI